MFAKTAALCDQSVFPHTSFIRLMSLHVSVDSGDDFFGDDFNEEFDAMEDSDQFHDKLEDGFKNWEERQELKY